MVAVVDLWTTPVEGFRTLEEWLRSTGATEVPIPWRGDFVRYDGAMDLEVRPGAEVLKRIENPAGAELPNRSDALTVTWKGTTYWVMLWGADGGGTLAQEPAGQKSDFADWVAAQVAANAGPASDDQAADYAGAVVRFDDAGQLVADEGYRILEQRSDVALPENFAPACATTGVALVEGDGRRTWWLGRSFEGASDYVPYAAEPRQTVEHSS